MHRSLRRWLTGAAIASVTGLTFASAPAQVPSAHAAIAADATSGWSVACPPATGGDATCMAMSSANAAGSTPGPLGPADLQQAYDLQSGTQGAQTVAVVAAYHYPTAGSDLSAYRSHYGIAACTTASGCFKQVAWNGAAPPSSMPSAVGVTDVGTAASLDMISAVCPNCHILLVEANADSVVDSNPNATSDDGLGAAENEAVALGAKFIVNPWGALEAQIGGANETAWDKAYFNHPGIVITAASSMNGFGGIAYPAASQYVLAVGGTDLESNGSGGWTATTWSSTGSGCSENEPIPAWQTPTPSCGQRMLNDVSAAAGSGAFGIAYDDTNSGGLVGGSGTAFSAAIIAALYALAGAPAPGSSPASYPYTHPGALRDVADGSTNGTCDPSMAYQCTAVAGYDGPTGLGTPFDSTAFHTVGAKPAAVYTAAGASVFVTAADGSIQYDTVFNVGNGFLSYSGWTSLGGTWPGYPTAISTSDGSIWVFAIDGTVAGGNLFYDHLSPGSSGTWSGWTEIGNPGVNLLGTPTAVQDKSGAIHVFARAASTGNLWENVLPGGSTTWSGFNNLLGVLPNNVTAVVGVGGWMYMVGVGNNSALYYDELPPGGTWTGWTFLVSGKVTGVPAIFQDSTGTDQVFVRQISDGATLQSQLSNGSWTAYDRLGGNVQQDPAAWAGHGGTNRVYVISGNGFVYDDTESSGTWSGYAPVGTTNQGFSGVPGVVQDSSNNLYLFARASNGAIELSFLAAGTTTWPAFGPVGGGVMYASGG